MADVDNRNRNRRSNRAGQPNPKREARAKATERHVATVSEACAKDIERSLAGVCEFDGMPAGFVAAMKAKAQAADAVEEQVAEESEAAEAETAEVASAETEVTAEPAHAEEATETESAPAAEEPAPVLPEVTVLDASATQAILDNGRGYAQFCDMAVLDFASFTTRAAATSRAIWVRRPRSVPIRTCTTCSINSANGTARTVAATSTASFTATVRWWCLRCASTATTCMRMPT